MMLQYGKRFFAAAIVSVFVVTSAPDVSAATWQFAGWCGGGAYPAWVPDPRVSGRSYLLSDVAGVWRSDDKGNKWRFVTSGVSNLNTAVLAIAPSDSNVLYSGTKGGVHKSTDAGATWTHMAATKGVVTFKRPDNYRSIAVNRTNPSIVYAGTQNGRVYKSSNGGSTWSQAGSVLQPFGNTSAISALYLSADGTYLFASSPSGVSRHNLKTGGAWTKVLSAKTADMTGIGTGMSETLYAAAGNKIASSKDDGASWSYTAAMPQGEVYRLAVRRDSAGVTHLLAGWISGWNGGVYLSQDGGKTWKNIETGLSYDLLRSPSRAWSRGFGRPNSLAFDPFNSNTIYFTDFWGAWRSDDGGLTWQERVDGAPNTIGSDLFITPNGTIWVASMDNGLMKSTDNGVSYKAACPAAAYNTASYLGHFWRVAVTGSAGTHVVATNSPWDVNVNQVAVSKDGGATFTLVRSGFPAARPVQNVVWDKGYIRALAVDPVNPNKLYVGIDGDDGGGLYISTNGGYDWTRSSGQPGSKRIYNGLVIDPTNANRIYWAAVGTGGGVYRSLDAGKTWTKVFSGSAYVFDLAIAKDGTVYAAADSSGPNVYVTRDKGNTWSLAKKLEGTSGTAEGIAVDPNNPNRVAVSTLRWDEYAGGKFYLSNDGGRTWQDITSGLPNGSGAADMEFSRDGKYLYVSRYAGSVYRVVL